MIVPGEGFPYEPITEAEKATLIQNCGGVPADDIECVRGFLAISGVPVVKHYPVWQLIQNAKVGTINAMNLRDETAGLVFNRGAYFYAGMLHDVIGLEKIPVENAVVNEIAGMVEEDPLGLGIDLYQKAQEVPSFDEVFDIVRPVLIGDSDKNKHIAMLGAGTVHYLLTESLTRREDPATLDKAHPELKDIFAQFGEMPD